MSKLLFPFLLLGLTMSAMNLSGQELVLSDFTEPNVADMWITVNDNVMGGKSIGGPSFKPGKLIFTGSTNTDGGGFSSIRTRPMDWDLGQFDAFVIRLRGSKRVFQVDLGYDGRVTRRRAAFRAEFKPTGEWEEKRIPFTAFKPTFFGRILDGPQAPVLEKSRVATLGFFIYDKLDGPFKLEVDWIKVVGPKTVKPKSKVLSQEAEAARYLGFLSGTFGRLVTSPDLSSDLTAGSIPGSGLSYAKFPEAQLVSMGLAGIGRLTYTSMFHPEEYQKQLKNMKLALNCADKMMSPVLMFHQTALNRPLAAALSTALWAEIDRKDKAVKRLVVAGIQNGSRTTFGQIRAFILEKTSLDIGGEISNMKALQYLESNYQLPSIDTP